ncbi:glycine zipper domain-containing protein [Helicobacter hepaticus]|jgi:hypothetical protein|uniref:Glycine zipper domain-containing protein n=1 Tax=Helicobacter hepaticus (strain ATCC 51449 / 3B1) TaxID=235279 RepID=Q7VI37_HELHP|nr:glycine zipper domain-containing protein [Helicobacter hepaticus]AAP77368.1 hypothetical protein HH_0771 [Helicobacter hepaticus ATCC 51449]
MKQISVKFTFNVKDGSLQKIKKELDSINKNSANELYALELKLHEQKMEHIQEYSKAYKDLQSDIQSALNEDIQGIFNGNVHYFRSLINELFSSLQSVITKGFATSISAAFMESSVIESMNKSLASAIDGSLFSNLFDKNRIANVQKEDWHLSEVVGAAFAGFGIGNVAGGLVGNFLGDEVNAQKTQKSANNGAMAGAAAGAAIGSFVPVIGTSLGGLVGGLVGGLGGTLFGSFNSTKLTTTAQGVELISKATKDNVSAREFADKEEVKKKWWGLQSNTSTWKEYYDASNFALKGIQQSIRGYEYLLQDIGSGVKSLSIAKGNYKSYADILNAGAKELIKSFYEAPHNALKEHLITPNINEIYNMWADYAKSVDKQVSEALSESLTAFVSTGQNFQVWLYQFKDQSIEGLKYQEELARKQVDRILENLGASDVNIDNYLSYREEALKESFDPQTIERINALGEALMQSGSASKKYEQALKDESKTKLNLIDPFLQKVKKLEDYKLEQESSSEKLQVNMLTTLKSLLRVNQESLEVSQAEATSPNPSPLLKRDSINS